MRTSPMMPPEAMSPSMQPPAMPPLGFASVPLQPPSTAGDMFPLQQQVMVDPALQQMQHQMQVMQHRQAHMVRVLNWVVRQQATGGDENEQKRVRAMIKARVAADVEAERRRRREEELEEIEQVEKITKKEYVDGAIESERIRRINDTTGETAKQRGARRLSLNFINDLIQKDPTFITKTWGY